MYYLITRPFNKSYLEEMNQVNKSSDKMWQKFWNVLHSTEEKVIHHQENSIITTLTDTDCDKKYSYIHMEYKNSIMNNTIYEAESLAGSFFSAIGKGISGLFNSCGSHFFPRSESASLNEWLIE
jgi:hypothetical protein